MSNENGKMLIQDLDYEDISNDYSLDDSEDSFFDKTKGNRQFFDKDQTESAGDSDRDFSSDYEFEEPANSDQNYYDTYTDADEQNFVFAWKWMDETRAAILSAKYDKPKEKLLFYPDIHKAGHNTYLKRAGGATFKKYSDLILYANKPEVILILAFLFSTYWMIQTAKKIEHSAAEEKSRQRAQNLQNMTTAHQQNKESTQKTEAFRPIQTS